MTRGIPRRADPNDELIVNLLRDARERTQWPPTPDVRSAVVARLEAHGSPDVRQAVVARLEQDGVRRSRRRPRLITALALAATLALAVAGLAAGLGFRLPGFEIIRVSQLPVLPTAAAGSGLDLGSPVPLTEVLSGDPVVRLPASLPQPATAYVTGTGDRSVVTVAWRAEPGAATLAGTDLALTLTALQGGVDEQLLGKVAGPGTTIEPVIVGSDRGWWIAGEPHVVLVYAADGTITPLRAAVAGDTLVFARDGTLYRLESSLGREATLEVARSMP